MRTSPLICASMSPDRLVAGFFEAGSEREVFAYLPHVAGLNPYLLRVGDEIEGTVTERDGRLELVAAQGQVDRRAL